MFRRIEIQHFKSIERAEIDLGKLNVFVGNNGSGKTNIIDAIRFIRDVATLGVDRAISDRHGIKSIRQWSPTKPYRIHIKLSYETIAERGSYSIAIDSVDSHEGKFSIFSEEAVYETWSHLHPARDNIGPEEKVTTYRFNSLTRNKSGVSVSKQFVKNFDGHLEYDDLIRKVSDKPRLQMLEHQFRVDQSDESALIQSVYVHDLWSMRRALTNFQAYSIYPNTLRTPQEPSNETYLSPEGRNLASVFKRMRKTKQGQDAISQITESMRAILPNLEKISILNVGGYLVPQFHMIEQGTKRHIFNVSQMSDGSLRMLGLLTALYQNPRPSVIALEEPEQTVNPGILTVLADAIKEVSKNNQVLVTTHSPHLLDHFDPDDVRSVELHGGKTLVGKITAVQLAAVRERLFSLGELLVMDGLHL